MLLVKVVMFVIVSLFFGLVLRIEPRHRWFAKPRYARLIVIAHYF